MAEQALAPGKGRMLRQGLVDERLFDGWQRSAFVVGLVLIVTAETELGHCCNQVIINVRAMRIVAGDTMPLFNGAVNKPGAVRNRIAVATDTQGCRRKLQ